MNDIKCAQAHYTDTECDQVIEAARIIGGKTTSAIGPATRILSLAAVRMTQILEEGELETIRAAGPPGEKNILVSLIHLARKGLKTEPLRRV